MGHHDAMEAHHKTHMGRSSGSQDAAVDKLNDESYAAAQKGEAFGSGDAATPPPAATAPAPGTGGKM
jgi:hypothetical protein